MVAATALMAGLLPVIALPVQRVAAAEASDPIITVAGNGFAGTDGDGGRATDAQLNYPAGVVRDGVGNLFIADTRNRLVRKVDISGRITTVAGSTAITGSLRQTATGDVGDGGPATQAYLNLPNDVAVDGAGNLYIADTGNNRIRKVDAGSGMITTVAGTGTQGFSGDDGPATQAQLASPYSVAFLHDNLGHDNLYIGDGTYRVRKVDLLTGTMTTVAGNGQRGFNGDGGPATSAALSDISGITVDAAGSLFIAVGDRVRKVDTSGIISTPVAGLDNAVDVAVDAAGNLLISSASDFVYRLDPAGNLSVLAGTAGSAGYSGDGGPASATQLNQPWGIALDASGALFIADTQNNRVRRIGPDRLALTMTHSPAATVASQPLTYTLDVKTFPGGPAAGVVLTDPLPAGATFTSASATQGSCAQAPGTVTCSLGNMAGAATARVTITVTAPPGGATLTNTATVNANEADTWPTDNTFTDIAGPATIDLSVAITDTPDPVAPSPAVVSGNNSFYTSPLTYTITVANAGPGPASTVTLDDQLPAQPANARAPANPPPLPSQGRCTAAKPALNEPVSSVHCDLGNLAAGASATVIIQVSAPSDTGVITDRATVAAHEPESNLANNSASEDTTVGGIGAGLGIANVDAPDPATVGAPLTYSVLVANTQPGSVTGVTLTDALPAQVSFVSASADQGSCANTSGVVRCDVGTMASNATVTARITVTPTLPGDIVDTATVQASGVPPTAATAQTRVSATGCGQVITSSTTLGADVGPCAESGLVVGADAITVDLGGHRVFGFPGSVTDHRRGIDVAHRSGVTVRNGIVSYFGAGVVIDGGGSDTVADLSVTDNVGVGPELGDGIVVFNSPANHITHNTLSRNGIYDGIGILGVGSDNNTVEANTVEDTTGGSQYTALVAYGQGIIVSNIINNPDSKTVRGTIIVANTVRRNGSAGISNINSIGGRIADNVVEDNGATKPGGNGIGVTFGSQPLATASDMVIEHNQVHRNALSGIIVNTPGNWVRYNDASNNAIARQDINVGISAQDLKDTVGCRANTWEGNTWGSGSYAPDCATAGGTGPNPPATPPPPRQAPPADFDHNGISDVALYRPSSGQWFDKGDAYRLTRPTVTSFGSPGDIAVPGDFDGDGHADRAVFRPSDGTWYVAKSTGGETAVRYGTSGDVPVPGDYDGDGKTDIAVFRPSQGVWYIHPGGGGPDRITAWGTSGDIPVPGDYNGDGKTDVAVFRPTEGVWYVLGGATTAYGTTGDIPVPGDYNGDGSTDVAVFRPSTGTWYVNGGTETNWGTQGDIPVPGDYDGNATTDVAVSRPSTGAWYSATGLTTNWGTSGDQPLELPAAIRQAYFP